MPAYYNEIDPFAAAWLRNLIAAGHIAPGDVDERSIAEVAPDDLAPYTQCHFFAGIGGWSYALRLAGWPDDRPAWTGSCPCQPFSPAGRGDGAADPRHLWPAWVRLIRERRPHTLFGEQVSGVDGLAWLDLVHADLEASGYAVGAVTLPAASVGAPHQRHRIFFVADERGDGLQGQREARPASGPVERGSEPRGLGDAEDDNRGARERRPETGVGSDGERRRRSSSASAPLGLEHADEQRLKGQRLHVQPRQPRRGAPETAGSGPLDGFWADAEWLYCRDGKWRPTQPGLFPLVDGAPARVGRLRAYGNAIVPQVAAAFIGVYMSTPDPGPAWREPA